VGRTLDSADEAAAVADDRVGALELAQLLG
jgi:hypothetical protein